MNESTPSFPPRRIGQIAINVHDLDRAVGFYKNVLGLEFLFRVPTLAFFNCGGVRLMLGVPESDRFDHPASVVYYDVPDIQAATNILKERGAAFESDPHVTADLGDRVLWLAFLADSEGNLVGLMSEVPKGG
jgi:predicted enzyme related to lactoylglutathione lyase